MFSRLYNVSAIAWPTPKVHARLQKGFSTALILQKDQSNSLSSHRLVYVSMEHTRDRTHYSLKQHLRHIRTRHHQSIYSSCGWSRRFRPSTLWDIGIMAGEYSSVI